MGVTNLVKRKSFIITIINSTILRISMVINFIKQTLGISNPFSDFTSNITRIASILYSMQADANVANFRAVKEKIEAIKRMMGLPVTSNSQCLIKLSGKKGREIVKLPHSGKRVQLETMERDMRKALHFLINDVVRIDAMTNELQKHRQKQGNAVMATNIKDALHFAEKMRARSHIQVKAYNTAHKRVAMHPQNIQR